MINYVNLERGEKMTFQEDIEQLKNQESWIVAETENYVIADSRGRTDGLPKSLLIEFDNWADLAWLWKNWNLRTHWRLPWNGLSVYATFLTQKMAGNSSLLLGLMRMGSQRTISLASRKPTPRYRGRETTAHIIGPIISEFGI